MCLRLSSCSSPSRPSRSDFSCGCVAGSGWLVFSILPVPHTHTPTRKEKGRATGGEDEKKEGDNFNNKKKKKKKTTSNDDNDDDHEKGAQIHSSVPSRLSWLLVLSLAFSPSFRPSFPFGLPSHPPKNTDDRQAKIPTN